MIEGDELIGRVAIQRKLRFLLEMFGGKEEGGGGAGRQSGADRALDSIVNAGPENGRED